MWNSSEDGVVQGSGVIFNGLADRSESGGGEGPLLGLGHQPGECRVVELLIGPLDFLFDLLLLAQQILEFLLAEPFDFLGVEGDVMVQTFDLLAEAGDLAAEAVVFAQPEANPSVTTR